MRGKISYFKIVLVILGVSLSMNIYLSINHYIYKTKALKNTYSDMRGIRERADSSLIIFEEIIKSEKYKGINILNIYDNISIISDNLIDLWEDYNFYEDKPVFNTSKIESDRNIGNDAFFRVEEYMRNILVNAMSDNRKEYKLTSEEKQDFLKIRQLLIEISNIFIEYDENELKNIEDEKKADFVVNKGYWIDMLDKINAINEKFSDYNFSKESKVVNEI